MDDIDIKKLRVLIIDDEPFMRQLIERILFEMEIENTTMAVDGVDGLSKFSETSNNFDLVICDLEMPNMNGFEFVKQLRQKKNLPSTNVPILIVTGHSGEDNVQDAVESGIHGYLVKPVSKTQLEKRIKAALSSPQIDPKMLK